MVSNQKTDWKRGLLRSWVVMSGAWALLIVVGGVATQDISWPWRAPYLVHIPISSDETWDYPSSWGITRIEYDIEHRREARLPKECEKGTSDEIKAHIGIPDQCFIPDLSPQWKDQLQLAPIGPLDALGRAVPLICGPPLLLLLMGSVGWWTYRGFRPIG